MADNGDQQRQRGFAGAPRGSKLPRRGSGSRRNDTSHRRTDSETTESPHQSNEAKPRLSNEATSLQAARKSFEAAAEKSPKVAKFATKKSATKQDRNERPAATGEANRNESKRRIEQQSRLPPRSPETTSTATFVERARADTPSRNPHSLEISRQSKIPSSTAALETRTHRRTPSSAASVASAVSSSDTESSPHQHSLTHFR